MIMDEEKVILVNEKDEELGVMNKTEAHRQPVLHRAFSIFIFNRKGEMLLQRRAKNKYHSMDLWSNTCCSHPRPGESVMDAADRRLKEEMGFDTELKKVFDFIYKASLGNGLFEHEFDHVLTGEFNGTPQPDKNEVSDYCYKNLADIEQSLDSFPEKYSAWFRLAFPAVMKWYTENNKFIPA